MYRGYVDDDGYSDNHADTASTLDENSGESDLDDLETRLYSQLHYVEEDLVVSTIVEQRKTEKTESQLLSGTSSALLPSTSCQAHNGNQSSNKNHDTSTSEKQNPELEKGADSILTVDSSALSTDDNAEGSREVSVIDYHESLGRTSRDIGESRRTIEYIVVDTESDGLDSDRVKKRKEQVESDHLSDSETNSEVSSVMEIARKKKVEFVSLISEDEQKNEDISIHARFGSESVMEDKAASSDTGNSKVGEDNHGVDVEKSTLEEIQDSLGDCDWSNKPHHRPVHIKTRGRYYQSKKCEKCDSKGHQTRDCPNKIPVCIQCGEKGHISKSCPRPVCYNCYTTGHTRIMCTEPRRLQWKQCKACLMQGHKQAECPNRWRQFHLTTDLEEPVRGENTENDSMYCSNCGKEGHFYHDCVEKTMFGKQWETWPFIAGYSLEKERVSLMDWRDSCFPHQNDAETKRKGKSKKKSKKTHHSKTVINMLDNHQTQNKGKKRKWKEQDEETEPNTSLTVKKAKLEPQMKKKKKWKKKKKKNVSENEGVDYIKGHSITERDTVPTVVAQAFGNRESRKKKKRKMLKVKDREDVSQKKIQYHKPHVQTSQRGFRYESEGGCASMGRRQDDVKAQQKWVRKRDKSGWIDRQNGQWKAEHKQGRRRRKKHPV